MSTKSLYAKSTSDYAKDGTVIPKATSKGPGSVGFTFDKKGIIPYNVIIDDPESGIQTCIPMTAEAILKQQAANRNCSPDKLMTYEQASVPGSKAITEFSVVSNIETITEKVAEKVIDKRKKKVAEKPKPVIKAPEPEPEFDGEEAAPALDLPPPIPEPDIWEACKAVDSLAQAQMPGLASPSTPKVKVKLQGSFGSLTVPYNYVYQHDIYLIMIQYDSDQAFYEAPRNDQSLTVSWEDQTIQCLPGPQFPLGAGSKVMVTVFFIEE